MYAVVFEEVEIDGVSVDRSVFGKIFGALGFNGDAQTFRLGN